MQHKPMKGTLMLKPVTDKTFHELVRETTKPMIVMFTGSWCQPCKNFLPVVEDFAKRMKGDITILTADIDENEQSSSDLNIRSVPSLALFSDGMIQDVLTGTHSLPDLRLWIQDNI